MQAEAGGNERPLLSVILAARNERRYIANVLESLLRQDDGGFDIEILVIDGKSSDGTADIAHQYAACDRRIRVLINDRQTTPSAFNLGLRESRGEFVAILGAHAVYDRNYLSACFTELKNRSVTACGGLVDTRPADGSLQAKLVSWTLGHWFGSSTQSFRTRGEGFTDSVNFPVIIKSVVIAIGGYDEQLYRNQDNDLNQRLRASGHKLFITAKTKCQYFSKASVVSLLKYGFRSGAWNLLSLKKNKQAMSLRHFVPFFFVTGLFGLISLLTMTFFMAPGLHSTFMICLCIVCAAYLFCGIAASVQLAIRERSCSALFLPLIFLSYHLSYGSGTCWALLKRYQLPSRESAPVAVSYPRAAADS